jgi:hypothetical protein
MSKAAELAALIGSQTALSNRNLVINGAMQVAQRGTSTSSITTGFTFPCVDRIGFNVNNAGTWTVSQSTDVPSGQGFASSLKLQCTTADASLAAADYIQCKTRIEANTLQGLAYGTSSAKSTTLSFWVKSAKTGTYIMEWLNQDAGNKHIQKAFTVDSANTWEKKELTIPGDTAGSIDNNNEKGIELSWWLGAGSNFTSNTLQTSWGALAQTARAAGVVNLADSTSNDWYITGIQWEVGEQATPFEHRSYADELVRCQRYYMGYEGSSGNSGIFSVMHQTDGDDADFAAFLPTLLRTKPSITFDGEVIFHSGGSETNCTMNNIYMNGNSVGMNMDSPSTPFGTDQAASFRIGTSGYLRMDAEL